MDYPPPEAVYWILKGCLEELAQRRMMRPIRITGVKEVKLIKWKFAGKDPRTLWKGKDREDAAGVKLWEIATKCYVRLCFSRKEDRKLMRTASEFSWSILETFTTSSSFSLSRTYHKEE